MRIEGHSWNAVWAKTKTVEEFVAEFKNTAHILPGVKGREEKLRKVYKTLTTSK